MFKKILKFLGKLHILKIGSYTAKGDVNKLIESETASNFSSSGFYGVAEEKINGKQKKKSQEKHHIWKGNKDKKQRIKKIIFTVLGVLFLIIALGSIFDMISAGREWFSFSDMLFIAVFLVGGILFLPFSYTWQDKTWGRNIMQISIFELIVFVILTIVSFEILQDIGDIIFGNFSHLSWLFVFYLVLVIFLWSLIFPKSLKRWERRYPNFHIKKWKYSIFVVFIVLSVIIFIGDISSSDTGSTLSGGNVSSSSHKGKTCLGKGQSPQGDEKLMQVWIGNADTKNTDIKNTFTKDDIKSFSHVIEGRSVDKIWWTNREICDMETDTIALKGDVMQYDALMGADSGSTKDEGTVNDFSLSSGSYAFNVFTSSSQDGPWILAKQINFTVQ